MQAVMPFCRREYRPVLVPLDVAAHTLRWDDRTILDLVDSGEIRWAFDVSSGDPCNPKHVRELRFWVGELLALTTQSAPGLRARAAGQVVDAVIGTNEPALGSNRVCQTLKIDHTTLGRLVETGLLARSEENPHKITRDSLASFLLTRLQN